MKRLLLLGAGHAQLAVLQDLARRPLEGWQVQLVTPFKRQLYSGMLPGWVAGHYGLDACAIALAPLAARAGASLVLTAGLGLDLAANTLACADGATQPFDLLSIDCGPVAALEGLPGAREHVLPIRPLEGFVAAWPALLARMLQPGQRFELALLGAGAAGVELALAIQHRALREGCTQQLRITLVGAGALPLDGLAQGARQRVARLLAQRGIRWLGQRRATRIAPQRIDFAQGPSLAFDACLTVTGAAAPAWPRAAGLACDAAGFIRVGPTLQALQHPHILAAGDVAAYADARPKSGVFAVRAGPVLARNLRALSQGEPPAPWTPQQRALYLVSTGDQQAIAAWGRWAWRGGWVWRWKDWIDRGFVKGFGVG